MRIFGYDISFKKSHQTRRVRNNYVGAKNDRLTADFLTSGNLVADEILRWHLPKLRDRSRDLAQNNDYAKNFFRKLKTNVVGPNGIGMQSKARLKGGALDKRSNKLIELSWQKWSKRGNASACTTMSLKDLLNLIIESVGRDGEVLIRKLKGYKGNKFRYALQVIEADHLDERLNVDLPNGNKIRLGVEKDPFGKPVAYHLFRTHPGDRMSMLNQSRIRVPADEIIHLFVKERPSQSRGVPWLHTAIINLRMLGGYWESELVASRVGASKMGFLVPGEMAEDYDGDGEDVSGNLITEVEPGLLEKLPKGWDVKEFNPNSPSGNFQAFTKAILRGVASGIGCSYESLANDREAVNFSSIRDGKLDERDAWKMIQSWFCENCMDTIYEDWLPMAIVSGELSLNPADIERLTAPKWMTRSWDWVDPLKDIQARVKELEAGLTSRTAICAEKGVDFEDLLEQLKEEKELMEQYGISFELSSKTSTPEPDDSHDPDSGMTDDDDDLKKVLIAHGGNNGNGKH